MDAPIYFSCIQFIALYVFLEVPLVTSNILFKTGMAMTPAGLTTQSKKQINPDAIIILNEHSTKIK